VTILDIPTSPSRLFDTILKTLYFSIIHSALRLIRGVVELRAIKINIDIDTAAAGCVSVIVILTLLTVIGVGHVSVNDWRLLYR